MDLGSLKPAKGSTRNKKRVGRGQGSGRGGTSTRGHKGAKQRSGYSRKPGFEGGQMPLQRRVPKFGFKNPNRVEYQVINLDDIQILAESLNVSQITLDVLRQAGKIKRKAPVKILGRGELTKKIDVEANAFSKSAISAIEAVGGSVVKL